ncbi:MAG: glycosyltransferase, partial [Steroidobacteraceae bacterium]
MNTPAPPGPLLSVIVPTLRDDAALEALLRTLAADGDPPEEILVVDGAASPATEAICRRHDARWLPGEPGRGAQLRQGAAQARGAILWFLHA